MLAFDYERLAIVKDQNLQDQDCSAFSHLGKPQNCSKFFICKEWKQTSNDLGIGIVVTLLLMYYICNKPETASLNSRSEIYGDCKHREGWTQAKS